MSGTATLDTAILLDDLVGLADQVRDELHRALGVRQWEVYSVLRTWTGAEVGVGRFTDQRLKLVPQPLVKPFSSYEYRLQPCGLDEAGFVQLEEVSLSYAEDELTGGVMAGNQQHYFSIEDAHGQRIPTRTFVNARPPYPDRVDTVGWILQLSHAKVPSTAGEPMPIVNPEEALYDDLGDMSVNGAVTPQSFDYVVPAGKRAIVQQVNFVIRCSSDPVADGFGNGAALTNGVTIQFLDTGLVLKKDPLDGSVIQRNEDWAGLGGAQTVLDVTGDMVVVEWFLPTPIALAAAQRLRVQVRDDLSGLEDFRAKIMGYEENA